MQGDRFREIAREKQGTPMGRCDRTLGVSTEGFLSIVKHNHAKYAQKDYRKNAVVFLSRSKNHTVARIFYKNILIFRIDCAPQMCYAYLTTETEGTI